MLNDRKTDSFGGTRYNIYGKKIYSHKYFKWIASYDSIFNLENKDHGSYIFILSKISQ